MKHRYRAVSVRFWTDEKIRRLDSTSRYVLLYLITCPNGHVSGLYRIFTDELLHDTGLTKEGLLQAFHELEKSGLIVLSSAHHIVWVRNMLRYQADSENGWKSAASQIELLQPPAAIVNAFLQQYPRVKEYPIDRVSIGHPAQDQVDSRTRAEQEQDDMRSSDTPSEPLRTGFEAPLKPDRHQEQEQEQEQEQDYIPPHSAPPSQEGGAVSSEDMVLDDMPPLEIEPEEERPGKRRRTRKPKSPPPNGVTGQMIIREWIRLYLAEKDLTPAVTARDAGTAKRLASCFRDPAEVSTALAAYFEDTDPWVERQGWSLTVFESRLNAYLRKGAS